MVVLAENPELCVEDFSGILALTWFSISVAYSGVLFAIAPGKLVQEYVLWCAIQGCRSPKDPMS